MVKQQIAISGLGGQGVLFITRVVAETALDQGLDLIASETHGMAVRGGAVISHLKVGPFSSPLIRAGQADLALYLAEENLKVHPHLIGPRTVVVVNGPADGDHLRIQADRLAEQTVGRRQAANLVLLGWVAGQGHLFTGPEAFLTVIERLGRNPEIRAANLNAFQTGARA